ncbi:MAG: glycine zipper domain-containing protein [Gammaproteobacteria bacterium]|nr:glycine zipper domain-containing protein [Gammaproteobacteria bacterium]
MKKRSLTGVATLLVAVSWHMSAGAETLASSMGIFSYPMQSQTAEEQSKDDYECFTFAKGQTGYDPMNPPQVVAQAPDQGPSGARLRGAARGAAAGAIVGEIADGDAGEGAAIGATLGAMRGGRQNRQHRRQQAQQAEQAAQQQTAGMEHTFKNAYGACIEARGYSVKY